MDRESGMEGKLTRVRAKRQGSRDQRKQQAGTDEEQKKMDPPHYVTLHLSLSLSLSLLMNADLASQRKRYTIYSTSRERR
jgi:hypothetical protein